MHLQQLETIIEAFEKVKDIDDKTRNMIDDYYEKACDIKEKLYLEYPILVKMKIVSKTKSWRNLSLAHNQLVNKIGDRYWYLNPINETFIIKICQTKSDTEYTKKLVNAIKHNRYYGFYLNYHFLPITVQQQIEQLDKIEHMIDSFQLRIDNANRVNKAKKSRAA